VKATVESQSNLSGVEAFRLPPLILHPFSGPEDTSVLMASSRASLALQGFLPRPEGVPQDLDDQLLRGRYAELRMLFYIGKDLSRWMEQSAESVQLSGLFADRRIRPETFGAFLVQFVPQHVKAKLEAWGVADFCALFRRSIGLHAIFRDFPGPDNFSADFLRRYHRHLDQWFEMRMRETVFERVEAHEFVFDLYASGEYTTMLEQSWSE
jgi:hypothetical protein